MEHGDHGAEFVQGGDAQGADVMIGCGAALVAAAVAVCIPGARAAADSGPEDRETSTVVAPASAT
ncbi:hypothetical protein [Streptomyces sp. 11x1]|uniref:hypothetical protein n=1 Tax=Streptomyces sp. 11x1 TaxID=3038642 RepID=UPI00293046EB|nr:hypothetical protein [Streptomyces sp. 11x1]WNZ14869.1 hypothetical protein P8T65_45240 [Streptomyces sp. 11x1]